MTGSNKGGLSGEKKMSLDHRKCGKKTTTPFYILNSALIVIHYSQMDIN